MEGEEESVAADDESETGTLTIDCAVGAGVHVDGNIGSPLLSALLFACAIPAVLRFGVAFFCCIGDFLRAHDVENVFAPPFLSLCVCMGIMCAVRCDHFLLATPCL